MSHVLFDECGHKYEEINHVRLCPNITYRTYKSQCFLIASPSEEAKFAERVLESCSSSKTNYTAKPGRCGTCRSYERESPYRWTFLESFVFPREGERRKEHSTNLSSQRLAQRDYDVQIWGKKMEKDQIKLALEESRKLQGLEERYEFDKKYAALRAQEDKDHTPLEQRIFFYDEQDGLGNILSKHDSVIEEVSVNDPAYSSSRCCGCHGQHAGKVQLELMKLPCGHKIHDYCFKEFYYKMLRNGRKYLKCPHCPRRYRILQLPKFPTDKQPEAAITGDSDGTFLMDDIDYDYFGPSGPMGERSGIRDWGQENLLYGRVRA